MRNSARPVSIRRDIPRSDDPYSTAPSAHRAMLCEDCGATFRKGRWTMPNGNGSKTKAVYEEKAPVPVVCPACHRIRDDVPAGVVILSGAFLGEHSEEIMRLIANEHERAIGMNPLNRVMHVAPAGEGVVEVHTTSDKLAQQIGKALHKAYAGEVKYQFTDDHRLTRVTWQRPAPVPEAKGRRDH